MNSETTSFLTRLSVLAATVAAPAAVIVPAASGTVQASSTKVAQLSATARQFGDHAMQARFTQCSGPDVIIIGGCDPA